MTPEQLLLYASGELSAEERRAVEASLAESADARRELARITRTLAAFESLPDEDVGDQRWASMLHRAAGPPARRWPRLAVAALLVLSAGGALVYGISQKKEADRLRAELAVAVALLRESGSVDRLRGVGLAAPQLTRNAGARAALARAMRSDPSPNVRLAVVDAIWGGNRHGALNAELLAALPLEPLPAVRLEMIAVAAQMNDPASRPVLESLVRSDPDPAVRARARDALARRGAPDAR